MAEPRIRYCRTVDGVSIAFWSIGQGEPIIDAGHPPTRLGDDRWRALLREHERITRAQLAVHGGSEIKTTGDGFMASFASTTQALECALALQHAFAERNASAKHAIVVRCGLNAGEPIAEDNDLFGTAVTLAARIASEAVGGEVLVSDVIRQLVAGKRFNFEDRGMHRLKGFEEPARLWKLAPDRGFTRPSRSS